MVVEVILWALAAYLIGSMPTAYLVGRLLKGIDIRQYGSGNVGGANVSTIIGMRAGIAVTVIDIAKGALVVALARWLDQGLAVSSVAAVAVTVGHNWSIFLRFTGGRGVGTAFGAAMVLDTLPAALVSGPGLLLMALSKIAGWKVLAELTLLAALAFPIVAWFIHGPSFVVLADGALVGVLVIKRLLGNPGLRPVQPLHRLLLYRLLLDRDVASYEEWVYRQPVSAPERQVTQ